MFPLLSTEIETPTSFLKLYSFPDEELLNNCIKEVENNNLGVHRFRKVGFFLTFLQEIMHMENRLSRKLNVYHHL
jgi:hypothetical protein